MHVTRIATRESEETYVDTAKRKGGLKGGKAVSGASAPPGFFSLTRGRSSRAAVRAGAIAADRRRSSPACS